jgi:ATPases with chaperone activity, ATP-binding subunit
MLSRDLEVTLNSAFKRAREARHEYMTVEHLLLGLLDNASAVQVLNACGANLSALRDELDQFVGQTTPSLPDDSERDTQPTLVFQRVLHVQYSMCNRLEARGHRGKRAGRNFFRARVSAVYFPKAAEIARIDV